MLQHDYAMCSPQMFAHSLILTMFGGVICRGACSHSGSQCSIWPAPRNSECYNHVNVTSSSGASCSILCAFGLNQTPIHASIPLLIGMLRLDIWE